MHKRFVVRLSPRTSRVLWLKFFNEYHPVGSVPLVVGSGVDKTDTFRDERPGAKTAHGQYRDGQ